MSNFKGTWHYARNTATQGAAVVKDKATIIVEDKDEVPFTVEIEPETGSSLVLSVDSEKTPSDISFSGQGTLKGRLVILSAAEPAILVGSIQQPAPPASGGEPRDSREDHNIDVFIAVKVC